MAINGVPTYAYTYDSNENRISINVAGSISNATYDEQDRLVQYGGATYVYSAGGELQHKTFGSQTIQYTYDITGNLRAATLPDATAITYVIDGADRRIGKRINGVLTQGFLYQDQTEPVAELDGSGNVVSRFVYGSRANVPDYMIKGGVTYRIIPDRTGSVRLVVDAATGAIAQRLDYDEFGMVLVDSNPGFQPFGFGGGIYDRQTGLTRFGARDYDAETGRWTAKEPLLFAAGQMNLYTYAANDPLNFVDPTGRDLIPTPVYVTYGIPHGRPFPEDPDRNPKPKDPQSDLDERQRKLDEQQRKLDEEQRRINDEQRRLNEKRRKLCKGR